MKYHKVCVLSILLTMTTFAYAENRYENISVESAKILLDQQSKGSNITLLDVRTEREYLQSHIEGAQKIDFYASSFASEIAKLDKSKHYLLYCRTGVRSAKTLQLMQQLGFEKVYNMQGGIVQWHRQELAIVTQ
ncbi:MAG: rhodanese-like domain-containing protein [Oceanospirillaceae bacterium]